LIVSGHTAPHVPDREPPLHDLPDAEFLTRLRELNGMAPEVLANAELMQLLVPILRADFELCETYTFQPGELLDCSLAAYGGLRDTYVTRQGLQAWRELTCGNFSLRMFPGDHFYLNSDRELLLQALGRELVDLM
jgi:medium-chain acyl-[acyl-carrier-protein] hydrolase